MTKKIRTRFAPSPTGEMHVGSLRTALYNYLYAKKHGGDFLLRIEDTDQDRFVAGAAERLIQHLEDFGLVPDESLKHGGAFGPYIQSQRLDLYKKSVQVLLQAGHAYYAFDTPEELTAMREAQINAKQPPKYDRRALNLTPAEIEQKLANNIPYVIRMKVPEGRTTFTDTIRGEISIDNATIDDQILLKSDGFPTYHLAVVVDDHAMEITHVIRGEEWIPSTPKHVLLYQMFGWDMPEFAHLPLLTNEKKAKLSKRHGDVSVEDFIQKGILPQALLNFVALLGWNPGTDQEIFTLDELIKQFDLKKVQKGSAVFDRTKLAWMNSQYIAKIDPKDLVNAITPFVNDLDTSKISLETIIPLFQERLESLAELQTKAKFLYQVPEYDGTVLIFKKSDKEKTIQALTEAIKTLTDAPIQEPDALRAYYDAIRENIGLSRAEMFWPMRVAVSGSEQSPDVFDIITILGQEESITRMNIALEKVQKI